jgi:luciferase family oxidoreductase group 1
MTEISLGALDFCRISPGSTAHAAIWDTIELAQKLDEVGYSRLWLGEHHTAGIAHSSPEILMPILAGVTQQLRIGSAGILLRLHSPFKVANNFRLLESIFPGRIDLGLAKGSAPDEVRQRLLGAHSERPYELKVTELLEYMRGTAPVAANPTGLMPPEIWILGGSGTSNLLAASSGTSLCLSLFLEENHDWAMASFQAYRDMFTPSAELTGPNCAIALAGICADTEQDASRLLQEFEAANGNRSRAVHVFPKVVGNPGTCAEQIRSVCLKYNVKSIIFLDLCLRLEDRIRSYTLLSSAVHKSGGGDSLVSRERHTAMDS